MSWTASHDNVGVSGYDLFRNGSSAGTTTSTSKTFSSLTCGTSYTLGVNAFDAANNQSGMSTVVASTAACADTQAPNAPTGLFVTGSTTTSISLSWSPAFDNVGVTGYDAYIGSTSAGPTTVLTLYTFAGLTCGTTYTLSVDAFDAAGNQSGKSSLTTSTAPCPVTLGSVTFNAPSASSTVSGSVLWSVQPTVAFDHVDFLIDGTVDWTEHSCPCYFNGDPNGRLDTTALSNGTHTLKASAYDAGGTKVAESSEAVTVSNTATPPPTTTTPPPTTTPTPPTTTTPPPTTTTAPTGGNCFASPGSCGYPDPAYRNVGVPAGTVLKPSGSLTVTTDGAVISGLDISGTVLVQANNVTIQNTRISCSGCIASSNADFAVKEPNGYSGLTIKDSEIVNGNVYAGGGVGGMNTFLRVYMHGCDECIQYDATATDSYFMLDTSVPNAHYEAFYNGDGTTNVQHSVILNTHEQTADVFMGGTNGPCLNHLTINNSLLAGGGYMFYPCGHGTSAGSSTTTITNNRFARCTGPEVFYSAWGGHLCQGLGNTAGDGDAVTSPDSHGYFPNGGSFGVASGIYCSQTAWSNNVWDDNGATVSC